MSRKTYIMSVAVCAVVLLTVFAASIEAVEDQRAPNEAQSYEGCAAGISDGGTCVRTA